MFLENVNIYFPRINFGLATFDVKHGRICGPGEERSGYHLIPARLKEVADRNLMKLKGDESQALHLKEESQAKFGWGSALQSWLGSGRQKART